MINEKLLIQRILAEFSNGTKGKTYILPPSQYIQLLTYADNIMGVTRLVQLDTCVMTFWDLKDNCLLSLNLLQWQDAALNELFDLVYPKLYDNRNLETNGIAAIWATQ